MTLANPTATLTDGRDLLPGTDGDAVTRAFGDMLTRVQKGEPVRADDYLDNRPPTAVPPDHLLDLVYAEFIARGQAGAAPAADELAGRFPHIAERIHRQLGLHEALESEGHHLTLSGAAAPDLIAPAAHPDAVGRYRVITKLGEGGQGVVYRGFHPELGRDVVIKIARAAAGLSEGALRAEAKLLAGLDHPGLARIYDLDTHDGRPFAVLEFVDGRTLDAVAAAEPVAPARAAHIVAGAASAVAYANGRGVVHRDLKPQNVMLDSAGRVRVIDFGLAKLFAPTEGVPADQGTISGTVQFMAPEQARGESDAVGPRADVFGLGGVLYFLLTGAPPYEGGTKLDLLGRAARGEWDRAKLAAAPPRLRAVCAKALSPNPADRYPTADALAIALRRAVAPSRRWLVLGGAIAACALVLGIWAATRKPAEAAPEPAPEVAKPDPAPAQPVFNVRLWNDRQGKYVNAATALPLAQGEKLRYEADAPANRHLTVFAVDPSGEVRVLVTRPPAPAPGKLTYPESDQASSELVAPAGTVVVLMCGRAASPVTESEVRAALGAGPWPVLPRKSLILFERDKVEALGGRGVGPPTAQPDPEGEVLRRLDDARKSLRPTCDVLAGVAFSFK